MSADHRKSRLRHGGHIIIRKSTEIKQAEVRTNWQASTPLKSHHSKIFTIISSGTTAIVNLLDFGADWECAIAEVATGGWGKGVIGWERVSRETIVMYDITPWGLRLPFKHFIGEPMLFSELDFTCQA